MKNLIRICFLSVLFLSVSSSAYSQNTISEEKRKLIAEMIQVTKADQQFLEITGKMLESMEKMFPIIISQSVDNNETLSAEAKTKLRELVDARFKSFSRKFREKLPQRIDSKKYVEELMYPIYDKYFTEKELGELVTFYKSETGQKFISVTPELVAESNKITETKLLPQILSLVDEIIKEEFPELNDQKSSAPPPPGKKPNK
ncbi:MAG: DUF2059 domain-containing protein [Pyrinomonadaceae bacterium]|nr:DUF2059 domain-containing protein [Pyrinomonadaceae bacterium]